MILTDREIQIALSKKQIIIEPGPEAEAYSSTSVDLTLDERLSEFKEDWADAAGLETAIDPGQKNFVAEKVLSRITSPVPIPKGGYLLASKEVCAWVDQGKGGDAAAHATWRLASRERVHSRAWG